MRDLGWLREKGRKQGRAGEAGGDGAESTSNLSEQPVVVDFYAP